MMTKIKSQLLSFQSIETGNPVLDVLKSFFIGRSVQAGPAGPYKAYV